MTEKLTEERTIEEGLQELDKIVEKLESREISLEDSFVMYQKGSLKAVQPKNRYG